MRRLGLGLLAITLFGFAGTASSKTSSPGLVVKTFVCQSNACCPCGGKSPGFAIGGGGICPEGSSVVSSELNGGEWCVQCGSHLELGGPDTVGDWVALPPAPGGPENFVCLLDSGPQFTTPTEVQVVCATIK